MWALMCCNTGLSMHFMTLPAEVFRDGDYDLSFQADGAVSECLEMLINTVANN